MAKGRRKLRRQLIKKMKKGYLTPGEREDLMELDREVNRANRQGALMTGAGLGTALAIASKTGALGRAGDALGDWLDSRKAPEGSISVGDIEGPEVRERQALEPVNLEREPSEPVGPRAEEREEDFLPEPDMIGYPSVGEGSEMYEEPEEDPRDLESEAEELEEERAEVNEKMREIADSNMYEAARSLRTPSPEYREREGIVEVPGIEYTILEGATPPYIKREDGGYTPFLRAMRSKIRKKYLR